MLINSMELNNRLEGKGKGKSKSKQNENGGMDLEFGEVKLVTMTVTGHIDVMLNLYVFSSCIPISTTDGEIGVITGAKFGNVIRGSYLKDAKKKRGGNATSDAVKKDFKNQCSVRVSTSQKIVNVKLFNNGKIVVTGCTDIQQTHEAIEVIYRTIVDLSVKHVNVTYGLRCDPKMNTKELQLWAPLRYILTELGGSDLEAPDIATIVNTFKIYSSETFIGYITDYVNTVISDNREILSKFPISNSDYNVIKSTVCTNDADISPGMFRRHWKTLLGTDLPNNGDDISVAVISERLREVTVNDIGKIIRSAFSKDIDIIDACLQYRYGDAVTVDMLRVKPEPFDTYFSRSEPILYRFIEELIANYDDGEIEYSYPCCIVNTDKNKAAIRAAIEANDPATNVAGDDYLRYAIIDDSRIDADIAVWKKSVAIGNINSKTYCTMQLDRDKIEKLLIENDRVYKVDFNKDRFPGVCASLKAQCDILPNAPVKKNLNLVVIYNTGNINISATRTPGQVTSAFNFIKDLITKNKDEVCVAPRVDSKKSASKKSAVLEKLPDMYSLGVKSDGYEYVHLMKSALLRKPRNLFLLKELSLISHYKD